MKTICPTPPAGLRPARAGAAAGPSPAQAPGRSRADRLLKAAGATWLVVCVAGQLLLAAQLAAFAGAAPAGSASAQAPALLLFAALIVASGALQLMPQLNTQASAFHRWNGRFYVIGALVMGLAEGLMFWTPSAAESPLLSASSGVNALAIVVCAVLTWRHALSRRFDVHRGWALRLFVMVSGVWLGRIGVALWTGPHGAATSFEPTVLHAPATTLLACAQCLLPLLALEFYLHAKACGTPREKRTAAAGVGLLTVVMAAGMVAAGTAV